MPEVMSYLIYDGNCAEALHFYEHALGARIDVLIRGADTPIAWCTAGSHCRAAACSMRGTARRTSTIWAFTACG